MRRVVVKSRGIRARLSFKLWTDSFNSLGLISSSVKSGDDNNSTYLKELV